jgi:hypothetical protein
MPQSKESDLIAGQIHSLIDKSTPLFSAMKVSKREMDVRYGLEQNKRHDSVRTKEA